MNTKDLLLSYLSPSIAKHLQVNVFESFEDFDDLTELRLRADKPILAYKMSREYQVNYKPTPSDIADTVERISQYSLYAMEEELRMGYLSLPGGHRVGVTGRVVLDSGGIRTIRPISGLNIRICRAVPGCGEGILPKILEHNCMIISPPGCGKTTLLRDLVRLMSDKHGLTIGLVDERSEIGGCYKGVPQHDVGIRTDILDGCPKAEGMMLLLRAMAPDVIVVDELGGVEDALAVENVLNAGIRLLCSVHGYSLKDVQQKPNLQSLFAKGVFTKFVVLEAPAKEGIVYDGC